MFRTILVATDGSQTAGRAVDAAIDLSIRYAARLCVIHVHLHGRMVDELERMAEIEHMVPETTAGKSAAAHPAPVAGATRVRDVLAEDVHKEQVVTEIGELILRRVEKRAREAGVGQVELLSTGGDYADGILDAIDDTGAELVVMGRRGLGRLSQMVLGSVSNKVVQHSGAAVLLIQ